MYEYLLGDYTTSCHIRNEENQKLVRKQGISLSMKELAACIWKLKYRELVEKESELCQCQLLRICPH